MNKVLIEAFFVNGQKTLIFKFILSIFIVLISKIIIYSFKKIIVNLLNSKNLNKRKKINSIISISSSIFKYLVYFFAAVMILSTFEINTSSIIATAGIGGIVIAFGVQSIVKDLFSGVFILFDNQYNIGDDVIINGISGEVFSINMRNTVVNGYDGSINTISNGTITTVVNLSKKDQRSIVNFLFPIDINLEEVKDIIGEFSKKFYKNNKSVVKEPSFLGVSEIGAYYVKISIVIWSKHSFQWANEKLYREQLLKEFNKKNIKFLQFQIKGDIDV